MKFKNGKLTVEVCDRCTFVDSNTVGRLSKRQCPFCRKWICEECSTNLNWSSNIKYCRVCSEFLKVTRGADLKRLGFKSNYDSITDERSIEEAINLVHQKYTELGNEAVSKMLSKLYQEAQNREKVAKTQREKLDEIKRAKDKLARLEKEKEEASKELFTSIDGNLPF